MSNAELDQEFIKRQQEKLLQIKADLKRMVEGLEGDIQNRAEDEGDLTEHDRGDMSQSLFTREMDATVEQTMQVRLQSVDRALKKVEEGTYGLDDDTGKQIPKGRLEAVPEAIYTVENQQRRERERRPPV